MYTIIQHSTSVDYQLDYYTSRPIFQMAWRVPNTSFINAQTVISYSHTVAG